MSDKPLRMNAYYFGFHSTGNELVDRILSAVACAGKAYHSTESWDEETPPYEPCFKGSNPVEWIQNAANDAAAEIEGLREQVPAPPPEPNGRS